MRHFAKYAGKRLLFVPAAALIVVTIAFGIVNLVPSDPASHILGDFATPEEVKNLNHQLGLDKPIWTKYADYMTGLFHGDLGESYFTHQPVLKELWQYVPSTLELIVLAILVATLYGMILGIVGAYFTDRGPDHIVRFLVTVTQSIPDFFLGLMLIYVLFFNLGIAPAPVGRYDLLEFPPDRVTGFLFVDTILAGEWSMLRSEFHHALMPVLTLGLYFSSYFAKTTHFNLSEALESPQVEFARACGLRERRVMGYAFRVARTPILTYGGILFAALIGGAAIVETVFAWNGVGQWAIKAIINLDVPSVQGFILVTGLATLIIFLVVDLLVIFLDPRVSYDQ